MTKTRCIQSVATILALYGGGGAFMTNSGHEWTMFLFPLGVLVAATGGPLARAVSAAFTFSLSALCAMIAWRALDRGTAGWFLTHYGMLALFWSGMSALVAAPLFERPAVAADEPEAEPGVELEAEPA